MEQSTDIEIAKAKILAEAEIAKAKTLAEAEVAKAKILSDAEIAKQKIDIGDKTWGRIQAMVLAIIVAIPSVIVALRVEKYHEAVNGKMDQLIKTTSTASYAEGLLDSKEVKTAKDKEEKNKGSM